MKNPRFVLAVSLVLLAAAVRLVPHPPNVTPVGAAALFAGAVLGRRWAAVAVPLVAMLASDFVIGFHSAMPVVYACFVASVGIGLALRGRTRSPLAIAGGATASATLFFVVTNAFVWVAGALYPHTTAGLAACYVAAIPFYGNQLAGDLFYSAVLFGGFAWASRRLPAPAAA